MVTLDEFTGASPKALPTIDTCATAGANCLAVVDTGKELPAFMHASRHRSMLEQAHMTEGKLMGLSEGLLYLRRSS